MRGPRRRSWIPLIASTCLLVCQPSRSNRRGQRVEDVLIATSEVAPRFRASTAESSDSTLRDRSAPWWLSSHRHRRNNGLLRSARRHVVRHLSLPHSLAAFVFAFIPLRSYFVAASAGPTVFVWEVLVSPGRILPGPHAALLHTLTQRVTSSGIQPLMFLANTNILTGGTRSRDSLVWDVRIGGEPTRIPNVVFADASPNGDVAVGTASTRNRMFEVALWRVPSGRKVSQTPPLTVAGRGGIGVLSAFPARGDLVAALVRYVANDQGPHEVVWSVNVWNVTSGERLCHREAAPNGEVDFMRFGFDGERALVCLGFRQPSLLYDLRRTARGYVLGETPWHACEAPMLSRGLLLLTNGTSVSVRRLLDGGGAETVYEVDMPLWIRSSVAKFSPDGRKAVLITLRSTLTGLVEPSLYVWDFATRRPPEPTRQGLHSPVFAPDSSALIGIGLDAVIVDPFDGSPTLKLFTGRRVNSIAVSGLFCG